MKCTRRTISSYVTYSTHFVEYPAFSVTHTVVVLEPDQNGCFMSILLLRCPTEERERRALHSQKRCSHLEMPKKSLYGIGILLFMAGCFKYKFQAAGDTSAAQCTSQSLPQMLQLHFAGQSESAHHFGKEKRTRWVKVTQQGMG